MAEPFRMRIVRSITYDLRCSAVAAISFSADIYRRRSPSPTAINRDIKISCHGVRLPAPPEALASRRHERAFSTPKVLVVSSSLLIAGQACQNDESADATRMPIAYVIIIASLLSRRSTAHFISLRAKMAKSQYHISCRHGAPLLRRRDARRKRNIYACLHFLASARAGARLSRAPIFTLR